MRQQPNRALSGNSFDDAIFETPRFKRALHNGARTLKLNRFDHGGDWETLCRSAALLARLYVDDARGDDALKRGCIKAADMCATTRRVRLGDVLPLTGGIERIDWSVDVPALYGWASVLKTVGGNAHDAKLVFFDRLTVQQALTRAFNSFDRLDATRYNSMQVLRLYLDDLKANRHMKGDNNEQRKA